jgi:hypothetical protein
VQQMPNQPTNVSSQQPPVPTIMQQTDEQINIGNNLGINSNQSIRPAMPQSTRQNTRMMPGQNQQNIQGQSANQPPFNVQGQQIGNFQQRTVNPQQQQSSQPQRWIAQPDKNFIHACAMKHAERQHVARKLNAAKQHAAAIGAKSDASEFSAYFAISRRKLMQ